MKVAQSRKEKWCHQKKMNDLEAAAPLDFKVNIKENSRKTGWNEKIKIRKFGQEISGAEQGVL